MSKPVLYVFAISHYCEKACWALDCLGIEYTLKHLPPGIHRRVARQLGAPYSSLPILQVDNRIVQGSSAIISWAENNKPDDALTLLPSNDAEDSETNIQLEKRLDDELGVHVRRYFYSEALVEYPHTVRPIFMRDLSRTQQILTEITWGIIRRLMIKGMDLGQTQGLDSRQVVEQELDWLDQLLADGRTYLVGEHFSRVDITAASLLAALVKPPQHPTYAMIEWPPNVATDCEGWQKRKCLQWARDIYARHR